MVAASHDPHRDLIYRTRLVVDPFLGIDFKPYEIDPQYYEKSCELIRDFTKSESAESS